MREYTIIGKVRDSGEYKGHEYDNVEYYCMSTNPLEEDLDGWGGYRVTKLKIKYELYVNDFRFQHNIGDVVVPSFDCFGNVREIRRLRKGEFKLDDRNR